MPDVSPTKWHRGHTTWFFETFLLEPTLTGYDPFDPDFRYLFNSYYETVGPVILAIERGLVVPAQRSRRSRATAPTSTRAMEKLIDPCDAERGRMSPRSSSSACTTSSSTKSCCSWTSSTCFLQSARPAYRDDAPVPRRRAAAAIAS